MTNYIFNFQYKNENTAGSKAKIDIIDFLKKDDFEVVDFPIYKNKYLRTITAKILSKKVISRMKNGKIIFQYPLYHRIVSNSILKELKKRNLYKIVIIHDVESLRLDRNKKNSVKREIDFLNQFDRVISHNDKMTKWLVENGLKTDIKNLEAFDYLNPIGLDRKTSKNKISFAGNLVKSKFLEKLNVKTKFDVMGPNPADDYAKNISYLGTFTPEKVPEKLEGSYGLVWDGSSTLTCNGLYGHYMKYNNPHKASLYLSSGLPIIIWEKAAMADFIKKNGLGIAIDNLNHIDSVLEKVSDEEYESMKKNAQIIGEKMRSGFYIRKAID